MPSTCSVGDKLKLLAEAKLVGLWISRADARERQRVRREDPAARQRDREYTRAYYAANTQKAQDCTKSWRELNKAKLSADSKAWWAANKEYGKELNRKQKLRQNFGITLERWEEMYVAQNGECPICESLLPTFGIGAQVDHSHKTGKVRAILCNRCNALLGHANDCKFRLAKAVTYLERHDG